MNTRIPTISDIMPTALQLLSNAYVPARSTLASVAQGDHVDQIVVWLIDGLGYDQVTYALRNGWMPILQQQLDLSSSQLGRLKTVRPSMTPVALASLLTGVDPAEHGILGQAMYENGHAVDVLRGPVPESWLLASPDIGEMAESCGVDYRAILEHQILQGSLTQLLHRHPERISTYIRDSGLPKVLNRILAERGRRIIYLYSSGIDAINHKRGAYSPEWQAEIETIDRHIGSIKASIGQEAWLWIMADHGHIPMKGEIPYWVLAERLPWLPARPAQVGTAVSVDVRDVATLSSTLEEMTSVTVRIVPVADYVNSGYFGSADVSRFMTRLGDYLLVPESGWTWAMTPRERYCWSHGGITSGEMDIPWIQLKIGH